MHVSCIVLIWYDNAIRCALIPKISRDSGENFCIYVFILAFFDGKSLMIVFYEADRDVFWHGASI